MTATRSKLDDYIKNFTLGVVFGIMPTPSKIIKYYANLLGGVHMTQHIDTLTSEGKHVEEINKLDEILSISDSPGSRTMLDQCAFDLYHAALPFARAIREAKALAGKHSKEEIEAATCEWFRSPAIVQ